MSTTTMDQAPATAPAPQPAAPTGFQPSSAFRPVATAAPIPTATAAAPVATAAPIPTATAAAPVATAGPIPTATAAAPVATAAPIPTATAVSPAGTDAATPVITSAFRPAAAAAPVPTPSAPAADAENTVSRAEGQPLAKSPIGIATMAGTAASPVSSAAPSEQVLLTDVSTASSNRDSETWSTGDILAVEMVDRATGAWRWAIVSVAEKPMVDEAEPNTDGSPPRRPSKSAVTARRGMWVRAWEPLPRKDLTPEERKEADRLESEGSNLVDACAKQRIALDEAQREHRAKQRCVEKELAEVEEHLRAVLPVLEAARAKVAAISTADIREIRSYRKPPPVVKRAVEPVQVLFGDKKNSKNVGDWQKAWQMMAAVDFVSRVRDLDPVLLPADLSKHFVSYMKKEFPYKKTEDGEFIQGQFESEIEAAGRASRAAGRLLEWVLAVREFIVRAPKDAKDSLQRVATLRQQQEELLDSIELCDAELQINAKRRALLDRAGAVIRLGAAAAALVDQQASVVAEPLVLLREEPDVECGIVGAYGESRWRPVPNMPAFCLPSSTTIGRLRRAHLDTLFDHDQSVDAESPNSEKPHKPARAVKSIPKADESDLLEGSAVGLSRFVLSPGHVLAVVNKANEGFTFASLRSLDIQPLPCAPTATLLPLDDHPMVHKSPMTIGSPIDANSAPSSKKASPALKGATPAKKLPAAMVTPSTRPNTTKKPTTAPTLATSARTTKSTPPQPQPQISARK